jgi:hypothetical protein
MLIVANSIQAYFREALVNAMRTSKIHFTESAQAYLVHLLNEFSLSERAFAGVDHGDRVTIAELLERALMADDHEALRIYRYLGDSSLYQLGFFKESKIGRIVPITYYMDMGAVAYAHASDLSRAYAINSAVLFQELADRFPDMVTVVENIAHYGSLQQKSE